jgi:osmotically-inducible protein OsmY
MFAGALLIGLSGCVNTGAKTGGYVDDSLITAKVKSEMAADKEVQARNINVITTKGVVTLSGMTTTTQESTKAAEIAGRVAGVKSVENNIEVQ